MTKALLFIWAFIIQMPCFAAEIRYFDNLSVVDGKTYLFVKTTPFGAGTKGYLLSPEWFQNNGMGFEKLKELRDLAKTNILPLTFTLDLATRVTEIQIRPEFAIGKAVEPYRILLDRYGNSTVWLTADNSEVDGNLGRAIRRLETTLPERVVDGKTFYFSKLVKNSEGFFLQVKSNPMDTKVLTIPLAEEWQGEASFNLFQPISIMANDQKKAVPLQFITHPSGPSGREIVSYRIVPSEITEESFSVLVGMRGQIVTPPPGEAMDINQALLRLGDVLPNACDVVLAGPSKSKFPKFFKKLFGRWM